MLKILLIDSWLLNNKVIEQDAKNYFKTKHIDYEFIFCDNPKDALDILKNNKIDITYIDISSEDFDGIQLLKDIKSADIWQPKITAVTVLYDKKFRFEALKLKVYRFIYKPYDYLEIEESLDKFFTGTNYAVEFNSTPYETDSTENTTQDDDSFEFDFDDDTKEKEPNNSDDSFDFDFDFDDETSNKDTEKQNDDSFDFDFDLGDDSNNSNDDFIDFDDEPENQENQIEHSKELMDAYNKSHRKVSSKEFLAEYEEYGYDVEELNELEEELDILVASILYDENLDEKIPDIINILEKYNRFLYTFSEFEELCKVLNSLVELLDELDFSTIKKTKMATKLLIAIIEDLVDWKEHVFVIEDAVDVFYINASILNSFILLQDVVKK